MGEGKRGVSVTECNQSGTGPKPLSPSPYCHCAAVTSPRLGTRAISARGLWKAEPRQELD